MSARENPLWTFIYLACNPGAAVDTAAALETLYRIPSGSCFVDGVELAPAGHRWEPGLDRFGKRQAATLLPRRAPRHEMER